MLGDSTAKAVTKPEVGERLINPRGRPYEVIGHMYETSKVVVRELDTGLCDTAFWPLMSPENGWKRDEQGEEAWKARSDKPLPDYDDAIKAAFPTRSGRHDLYAEAARMVGARYSKAGLIALVNMLLHRIDNPRGN